MPLRHLQFVAELLHRRLSVGRLDRHRLLDRSADISRDALWTQVRHRRRGDPQVVRDELLVGVALVRGIPGDQRVNRCAKGVDVGRDRRRFPAEHLGRGVGDGAGEVPGHGFVPIGDAGGPEVAQLRFAVIVDEHVRGLDIAVQRACPMRGFQRPAQLHSDAQCLGPRVSGPPGARAARGNPLRGTASRCMAGHFRLRRLARCSRCSGGRKGLPSRNPHAEIVPGHRRRDRTQAP